MSLDSCVMAPDTEARSVLFHGLADRSRLSLVEALAGGALRVSDLVDETGLSQSNVSRHLACLWDCGLVERERHGREVHYRLVEGLDALLSATDELLASTGDRVVACPRYGRATMGEAA
jgi:ArsR family transcriptional regulator, cadmium/lead-responsive transcriptional repressor